MSEKSDIDRISSFFSESVYDSQFVVFLYDESLVSVLDRDFWDRKGDFISFS